MKKQVDDPEPTIVIDGYKVTVKVTDKPIHLSELIEEVFIRKLEKI